jgi:hypothetical protein
MVAIEALPSSLRSLVGMVGSSLSQRRRTMPERIDNRASGFVEFV